MTTEHPEIARLSNFLWLGFERLPAYVESETCKKYLLTLFFLKAITSGQQNVAKASPYGQLNVPPEAHFALMLAQRHEVGNVERVNHAIRALARANPDKLGTLPDELAFQSVQVDSPDTCDLMLGFLLAHLGQPESDVRTVCTASEVGTILGGVFSEILYRFGAFHRESCAMFTQPSPAEERSITPRPIAQLMAQLLKPTPGDTIFDPACGTAGLLVACAEQVRRTHQSAHCWLFGQDVQGERCALSRMHLLLYGLDAHRLKCGDTISDSLLHDLGGEQSQFDVVLSVPPTYVAETTAYAGHARFQPDHHPRKHCPGLTFAMHMRACLRPKTGRMAVLFPIEALSRSGTERDIREQLLNANAIDSVICLPLNLFPGYPHKATALLLLRHEATYAPVFFVDARQAHNSNTYTDTDATLSMIANAVLYKREIEALSRLVSWSEIAQAGFDLAAPFLNVVQEEQAA